MECLSMLLHHTCMLYPNLQPVLLWTLRPVICLWASHILFQSWLAQFTTEAFQLSAYQSVYNQPVATILNCNLWWGRGYNSLHYTLSRVGSTCIVIAIGRFVRQLPSIYTHWFLLFACVLQYIYTVGPLLLYSLSNSTHAVCLLHGESTAPKLLILHCFSDRKSVV